MSHCISGCLEKFDALTNFNNVRILGFQTLGTFTPRWDEPTGKPSTDPQMFLHTDVTPTPSWSVETPVSDHRNVKALAIANIQREENHFLSDF